MTTTSSPIRYTPRQLDAIRHRKGNLLIIACAGSGKTEVISRRIAELVAEGVERESLVAFSFTERAAAELKARIRLHLEALVPKDPALGGMYVGTIHGFAFQLLKDIEPSYRNYEIIDEVQQIAFICSNFYDIHLQVLSDSYGLRWFQTVQRFADTLNVLYIEDIDPSQISDPNIRRSVEAYHSRLKNRPNQFLDFDSIVNELISVLKSRTDARKAVQRKYRHVVVDEYQDIDPRQEELIRLLVGGGAHLCVVGDDDQAIYGWRGAQIDNILTFHDRHRPVTRVDMVENFRSTHAIAEVANRAVRRVRHRLPKSMNAVQWRDGELAETLAEVGDIHRISFQTPEEEASYIADRLEALRGVEIADQDVLRGLDWADMAVLFRSVRGYAGPLVDELRRRKIPHVVKGARGLFGHEEIALVQAALHLLTDQPLWEPPNTTLDEAHLRARIRALIKSLSAADMPGADASIFLEWIARKTRGLNQAALPRDERPRSVSRRVYPQDIFHEMLDVLGASRHLWSETVLFNLGRFSNLLTKYEAIHQWFEPRHLKSLVRYLDGWALRHVDEGGPDEFLTTNAVQILTVHAAKGLEWHVVFIPSVRSHHFPSSKRNHGTETFVDDLIAPARYASGDDGERRLWYVALTRARKFLEITAVDAPRVKPTQYFTEICHNYVLDTSYDPAPRTTTEPVPPTNAELLPTTYSDLSYYWRCPFDYKLRRLMGFGPRIGPEFGYGIQIHNILTMLHERAREGNIPDDEDLASLVDRSFNLRYTTGEPLERMKQAATRTLSNYMERMGKSLPHLVLETEKPFEFIMGDALVSGSIDLLERVDEKTGEHVPVGVVDFKTGIDEDQTLFRERVEDASRQVRLYAIAARDALRLDPKRAAIHFLDSQKQIRKSVSIGTKERESLQRQVEEAVAKIKSGQFPRKPRDGKHQCKDCDHRKFCPGAQETP